MSTAIVTGAASGMGRAATAKLLGEGWEVVAVDIGRPSPAADTEQLRIVQADITDRGAVKAGLEKVLVGRTASVDLVANVAGIYPPTSLDTFTEDLYRRIFGVNVLGTLNVIAEAVPTRDARR